MCFGAGGVGFKLNICYLFRKNYPVSRMEVRVGVRRRVRITGSQPASEERKEQVLGPALSRTTTSQDVPAQRQATEHFQSLVTLSSRGTISGAQTRLRWLLFSNFSPTLTFKALAVGQMELSLEGDDTLQC